LQIEPEEFRRRYAELSDEALLSINRKELTELAQSYYDAEVAQRGLDSDRASEDTAPDPEMDLVPVATFRSVNEAQLGRDLLRAADIPAYLENELTATWTGAGGLRLMVPASFLEQSEEILEARISDEELIAQAEGADSIDSDGAEDRD
jgi:hypothetical protein